MFPDGDPLDPTGFQLDPRHPLARYVVQSYWFHDGAAGGYAGILPLGKAVGRVGTLSSGMQYIHTAGGRSVGAPSSTLQTFTAPGHILQSFSHEFYGIYNTDVGGAGIMAGITEPPPTSSYDRYFKYGSGANPDTIQWEIFDTGAKIVTGGSITRGSLVHLLGTSTGSQIELFVNGVSVGTTATTNGGYTGFGTPTLTLQGANTNQATQSRCIFFVVYDKPLNASEVRARYQDKFALLAPTRTRLHFFNVAAGSNFTMVADQGSYALTGQNALFDTKQTSAQGSYSLSGQNALFNLTLTSGQGAYALSGQDVALSTTGNLSMTAAQGSYSLTGQTAIFAASLLSAQGSYALTGQNAAFDSTLTSAQGSYSLTGQTALLNLSGNFSIAADLGVYTLAGQSIIFGGQIAAVQGAYSLSGQDVILTFNPNVTMLAGVGTYALTGKAATFVLSGIVAQVSSARTLKVGRGARTLKVF